MNFKRTDQKYIIFLLKLIEMKKLYLKKVPYCQSSCNDETTDLTHIHDSGLIAFPVKIYSEKLGARKQNAKEKVPTV